MRKSLLSSVGVIASFASLAQLPVGTAPENKNVVLEEFTGIHCVYCPDGHVKANAIKAANPNDAFLINVHTGGYATPGASEPDFRTNFGSALGSQSGLAGYPSGTVNRHVFSGTSTALSRSVWAAKATDILGQASYANVALEATLDVSTRELTVDVEVHFTGTAPANVNLNVVMTQDDIEGPQTGGSNFNPSAVLPNGNYVHNHMLRHMITGQWGVVVSSTAQGTTFSDTYTYTIPDAIRDVDVELNKIHIIAFIAEGQQEIITGNDGPIDLVGFVTDNGAAKTLNSYEEICGNSVEPTVKIQNKGSNTMTSATITYDVAGQNQLQHNWTGSLATFESDEFTLPAITVPASGGIINVTISDVNGNTDSDPSDNDISSANVSITDASTVGEDYTFTLVQDRYGSEITWEVIEDATGNTLASGGPYTDLAASGTQDHVIPVSFTSNGCYTLTVFDSYGDGINSGAGAGNFKLVNDVTGLTVVNSDGTYGSEERKPYSLYLDNLGTNDVDLVSSFVVSPNPVSSFANVQFNLNSATDAKVEIYNAIGVLVYSQIGLQEGANNVTVDASELSNGMYFFTVSNENSKFTKKITVLK